MASASALALSNVNSTLSTYRNGKAFFSPEPRSGGGGVRCFPKRMVVSMTAAGTNGRDSLDHLQRVVGKPKQQQQQQPRRRVPQSNPIGLWDRFPSARTVQQMMDTMDRIMEDPFAYSTEAYPSLSAEENVGNYRRGGRTPWEIKEGEGEYRMRFDMPGMTRKDVKVWVEERLLVVRAEKLAPPKEEGEAGEAAAAEEWPASSYGRYNSRIALPDNVEVEKIKAEVKDGVLYITIPKVSASAKVLDIDVQ
ncbi:putative small heat shock protein, chloroplastic isoform X2 [Iris pallida]|uniref:Small heat shock protein, chloroplastic isoform X2 n=1 Tax=Iris pallida TaxID=29817 RepID=A0AAX6F785_IRIPA|nr:putative small heat shock protein, chloroplastic isoform X2 [Iris pallida]